MQTLPDIAKTFNEFQYPALVDLIKETLTLAVGTLVLSITFVEKVIIVTSINLARRNGGSSY